MKLIIIFLLGLASTAFAQEPKFINLPAVSLKVVTTVPGDQLSGPTHIKAQKAALAELKEYVETQLHRQPMESQCKVVSTVGIMSADSTMTRTSHCMVSFL